MIDHLLWAVPDLATGCRELTEKLGCEPTAGGRHPGAGTWNALLDLHDQRYLEVIARDPTQDGLQGLGRLLTGVDHPRLVSWCARTDDIQRLAETAEKAGLGPGPVTAMQRERPGQDRLEWKIVMLFGHGEGELVPFFIQWGDAAHPTRDLPPGCRLERLQLQHPKPEQLAGLLAPLGLDPMVEIVPGDRRALRAQLQTPRGPHELTSL